MFRSSQPGPGHPVGHRPQADGKEDQKSIDDSFPILDLDAALVDAVVRSLTKAKVGREEPRGQAGGHGQQILHSLLAVSPSVARLVLSSSAEWRVDLEGLAYVAWCLGVKPRDEGPSKKMLGTETGKRAEAGAGETGIPPGYLILDHAEPGHMDAPEPLPTLRLLSDMASQGLIRGLELRGYWGNAVFSRDCTNPLTISSFERPWARFLSDVAPLLTRLDIGRCSDEDGPSDRHLEPLTSSPASFPRLQCVKLLYLVSYDEGGPGSGPRTGEWVSVDTLSKLITGLPLLRNILFMIKELEAGNPRDRTMFSVAYSCNNHARILVEAAMRILSDPRATESPIVMRTGLGLAVQAADFVASALAQRPGVISASSQNVMGPMLQRILSLLLGPAPEGPEWTPYALHLMQSLALEVLDLVARCYRGRDHNSGLGSRSAFAHRGLPFAFGKNLDATGGLSTLSSLALPLESDSAVAAALSRSFVDPGGSEATPLELARSIPLKATSLLSKLCNAKERSVWDTNGVSPGPETKILAVFHDALLNFDRPDNQRRAAQFFVQLDECAFRATCPVSRFIAGLSQRALESSLLQDLREGAAASGSGQLDVDPSRIPDWFRAATMTLRSLLFGPPDRPRRNGSTYPCHAEESAVLLNLLSIPDLDLSGINRSIMPQITEHLFRAFDEPDAPAETQALVLEILLAFGAHAKLIFDPDSIFWPFDASQDAEQSARVQDILYILPILAIKSLSRPRVHVHGRERLWGVVRSIFDAGGVPREGWLKLKGVRDAIARPVPFERLADLFRIASTDLVSLELRFAALVVPAFFVLALICSDMRQDRLVWTKYPSLRALYRDWVPMLENAYVSRRSRAEPFGIGPKLPSAYSEGLPRSLPMFLSLWALCDALSDKEQAALGYGLDSLGILVCAAVASTPAGQPIPTAPFTAAELVARLVDWAVPEEGRDEKRLPRISDGEQARTTAGLALERLVHDSACEEVLFTRPYVHIKRLLGAVAKASIEELSHSIAAALVRAARRDPSGFLTLLNDTPLCSAGSDLGTLPLPDDPWCELDSPAVLEIAALVLRHSLMAGSGTPAAFEVAALAKCLGERLAVCADGLLTSCRHFPSYPGELLLRSMAAHLLRALVLATEGEERADLLQRLAPLLQEPQSTAEPAAGNGQGKGKGSSEDTLAMVLTRLQKAAEKGPPDLAARMGLQ